MENAQCSALVLVPVAGLYNVLGYTPIERTLIALQKTGVRTVCLLTSEAGKLQKHLAKNVNGFDLCFFHPSEMEAAKQLLLAQNPTSIFVFQQPMVVDISVLEDIQKMATANRTISAASGEITLLQAIDFQPDNFKIPVVELPIGHRSCHPVLSKTELREVKARLMRNLTKPADGWVSRNINRRFSKPISRVLAYTPITPNIVTGFTGILAFLPIYFMYQGGYWNWLIGAGIYQLASILDGVDGELARLKMKHSKFGQWLDTLFDFTSGVAVLLSLALGVERAGYEPFFLPIAGYIAVFAGVLSIISLSFYVVRTGFGGNFRINYSFYDHESRGARLLQNLSFLGKRDFYIFFFLLLAVAGLLPWALVYFAVMAGLVFVLSLQTHFLVKTA
ncbi:MAG: CDP-alcohol phosphatidyltransferase family protein [Saprospiraceae bacterium]|nr:CDP-alcohol phosphatidyltransferase family protein [Saprospiraceae bacterium]MCF8251726.1 CDP-alcohol phosphatidyltransferase family protein [Saprospiraceae bacterium]MCF8281108.1 CDP-alcohol phosphatidyltransferase family protein [Bacteroidales bacterium]MCF8311780.1 CDP-alcohol phosphatidyltransferase family protein [Saprospiraceae bacterium]MCF8441770.1 CDP-alcohol phosphatidyltransferase family protein [Saprospiraceae bacterium]